MGNADHPELERQERKGDRPDHCIPAPTVDGVRDEGQPAAEEQRIDRNRGWSVAETEHAFGQDREAARLEREQQRWIEMQLAEAAVHDASREPDLER
jgi:hypothetical protein